MYILTEIISFILILGLISIPILLFLIIKNRSGLKYSFLIYLFVGLIITVSITWTFAWWVDYSNQLLMNHYGYDFNAMNNKERFENVELENFEKVKQLEIKYCGIGWPLKAVITFFFYSPYLLVVYLVGQLILRIKRNHRHKKCQIIRNIIKKQP